MKLWSRQTLLMPMAISPQKLFNSANICKNRLVSMEMSPKKKTILFSQHLWPAFTFHMGQYSIDSISMGGLYGLAVEAALQLDICRSVAGVQDLFVRYLTQTLLFLQGCIAFHCKCDVEWIDVNYMFTSFPSLHSDTKAWLAPGLWLCGGFSISYTCSTLRQRLLRCHTCQAHVQQRGQTPWSAASSRRLWRSRRIRPNRCALSCNPRRCIGWEEVLLNRAQLCLTKL